MNTTPTTPPTTASRPDAHDADWSLVLTSEI